MNIIINKSNGKFDLAKTETIQQKHMENPNNIQFKAKFFLPLSWYLNKLKDLRLNCL